MFQSIEHMRKVQYLDGKVKFSPRMSDGDESFNYDFVDGRGNDILSYNKINTYNVLESHLHVVHMGVKSQYLTLNRSFDGFP